MPTTDPVGTALAAIGAGSTTGATVMTGGVFAIRLLQATDGISAEGGGTVITATLFGGIIAAVATGWIRSRPIDDVWRRGVTGAVAVLGAALLAIAATAIDQFSGLVGLGVYGFGLLAATIVLHRLAVRAGRA